MYLVSCLKVRYPVLLTPTEKQIARNVCQAFRQAVHSNCFSLLMTTMMKSTFRTYVYLSLIHYELLRVWVQPEKVDTNIEIILVFSSQTYQLDLFVIKCQLIAVEVRVREFWMTATQSEI